ncbi:hypothetical protein B0H17DRAFT_1201607 [Mycena rosella]|uniref:Uncharacterized protein n=1 Tax=Mycena rosella TaxID=1033263 RepID=A0AAD7GJ58_MYCRO|nr:hypothetical protein B0H17DRAFT_1201607 [Mycena rosella]
MHAEASVSSSWDTDTSSDAGAPSHWMPLPIPSLPCRSVRDPTHAPTHSLPHTLSPMRLSIRLRLALCPPASHRPNASTADPPMRACARASDMEAAVDVDVSGVVPRRTGTDGGGDGGAGLGARDKVWEEKEGELEGTTTYAVDKGAEEGEQRAHRDRMLLARAGTGADEQAEEGATEQSRRQFPA